MKKRLTIFVIIAMLLGLCACAIVDNSEPLNENNTNGVNSDNTDLTIGHMSADVNVSKSDVPVRTLNDYLDNCEAAVRVEIIKTEKVYDFHVRYTCRVEEDYFNNLNYYGMENGYISVYDSKINYEPGDFAYMFLTGEDIDTYPHIAYLQLPTSIGYIDTKLIKGVPVPVTEIENETNNYNVYGLTNNQNLESEIKSYAAENAKSEVCKTSINSYKEMAEVATETWLIEVKGIVSDVDYGEYAQGFDCEIIEVYRTETGAVPGWYSREVISIDKNIEVGDTYLYFKGTKDGISQVISREYSLISSDATEFAEVSTIVEAARY